MHIEEVIIDGFKSYAQRTVLQGFDPHFNAITGLNGSGKSNILDSICFVLGITNLSQVRVGNLQELVYKQGQAGVTKASVTLVFNNKDKKGSPVGYDHYDEITITRQIVIGGKNKYLINGHTAQKQQVENLFHSVQLNVNNPHFLIMQGRITKASCMPSQSPPQLICLVLNMKPPEILGMIEEAAGTRMFENKKQSALKTIAKKQQKVDEISKILAEEITPTLEKLRGEKTHYQKWSANNAEIERTEKFCVAHQYQKLQAMVDASSGELEKMKEAEAELEGDKDEGQAEVEAKEKEISKLAAEKEKTESGDYKKAVKREEELSKALVKITSAWQNKQAAVKSDQEAVDALKSGEAESEVAKKDKAEQIEASKAGLAAVQAEVDEKEKACEALQSDYQNMCAGVASEGNSESLTLTDQIAEAAAEVEAAQARVEQGSMKIQHLKSSTKEMAKKVGAAEKEVKKLVKDRDAAAAKVAAAEKTMSTLNYDPEEASKLQQVCDTEKAAIRDLRETVEGLSAQLAGRLNFDFASPAPGFDRSKVKGMVANLVRVQDPATSTALEVAAGGKLYQVVVDNEQTGKLLLQKGKLRRRVTIIPLNKISRNTIDGKRLSRASAVASKHGGSASLALELVGYDKDVKAAMEYVFGSSIVCDTLGTAREVAFDKGVKARSVSLGGDSFEPQGTLTGKRQLLNGTLGVVLGKLQQLQAASEEVGTREERLSTVTARLKEISAVTDKYIKMKQQHEIQQAELEILDTRLGESHHAQLAGKLAEMQQAMEEAEKVVADSKVPILSRSYTKVDAAALHQKLQKEESSFRERRESLLKELEGKVKKSKADVAKGVGKLKKEQQKIQVGASDYPRIKLARQDLEDSCPIPDPDLCDGCAALSQADVAQKKSDYNEAKAAMDAKKLEIVVADSELKALRKERDTVAKKAEKAALELKKLQHKLQRFMKDSADSSKHLSQMLKKYTWIENEKQYFGVEGSGYDFTVKDPEKASQRLKSLQAEQAGLSKKINKKVMGMIEKAEDEYKELVHKKKVIENDKAKIENVISELDQKKNQALQTTWVKVNRDFGSIFATLLPGTSAKLEPPEGGTVLDGLEVKVAFGKVWKESLTELSGGQRSLLALSLILSLLLFKPAPMYILDEVDAALDLSHTQNIGTMLKTHFSHSQFIVVSLKEGMFNNANVIYRTRFVDGISQVGRTAISQSSSKSKGKAAITDEADARRKRGRTAAQT
ncbi:unnamed protein product [Chrysoparadoxa australica]